MIIAEADYIQFLHNGKLFVTPTNPGAYPANVDPDAIIRERQIAKHKAEQAEFETYKGIENFLRKAIIKSVGHDWVAELESKEMGFNHRTLKEILDHLQAHGGDLNHTNFRKIGTKSRHLQHCL
ncbi:hypothetical protein ACHAXN_012499 [Cyclotella atomus]